MRVSAALIAAGIGCGACFAAGEPARRLAILIGVDTMGRAEGSGETRMRDAAGPLRRFEAFLRYRGWPTLALTGSGARAGAIRDALADSVRARRPDLLLVYYAGFFSSEPWNPGPCEPAADGRQELRLSAQGARDGFGLDEPVDDAAAAEVKNLVLIIDGIQADPEASAPIHPRPGQFRNLAATGMNLALQIIRRPAYWDTLLGPGAILDSLQAGWEGAANRQPVGNGDSLVTASECLRYCDRAIGAAMEQREFPIKTTLLLSGRSPVLGVCAREKGAR